MERMPAPWQQHQCFTIFKVIDANGTHGASGRQCHWLLQWIAPYHPLRRIVRPWVFGRRYRRQGVPLLLLLLLGSTLPSRLRKVCPRLTRFLFVVIFALTGFHEFVLDFGQGSKFFFL